MKQSLLLNVHACIKRIGTDWFEAAQRITHLLLKNSVQGLEQQQIADSRIRVAH